jgi:drug/metabolite transporter (DMT)-like permease
MITALLIAVVVIGGSAGDVLITKGMKQVGEISTRRLLHFAGLARQVLTNRDFLLGVCCMAASFFAFLAVLSRADLSFVLPATSLSFVLATIGARLFLKERISGLRWMGTLLVCVGVALVSLP